MIKAGIFDVGGVLIEWDNEHIIRDISKTLKLSSAVIRDTWKTLIGNITEEDFWLRFTDKTGTKHLLPEESLFLREFKKRYSPNTEVLEIVKKLDEGGITLAILSNTITSHVAYLEEKGIYQRFPITVFSHEVGIAKPDATIYELTLKKVGVQPEQAFFVDDRVENIAAANKLGIKGIHFQSASQLQNDLRSLGVSI
jgi:epoxide hydrolase-like predicted phosphatase